jgi:hypothetical protein
VIGTEGHTTLWRVSPTEPTSQRIAAIDVPLGISGFGIAAPRVLLREGHIVLVEYNELQPQQPPQLVAMTLTGQKLGVLDDSELDGFDFNGSQVLTVTTPCVDSFLETWTPGESAPNAPKPPCPAPKIARVSFRQHGIRVALTCPVSPPVGCTKTRVEAFTGRHDHVYLGDTRWVELQPGESQTLTIQIYGQTQRWLRRHPHAVVEFTTGSSPEGSHDDTSLRTARIRR